VDRKDAVAFVRAMARALDSIIREARGEADPWRKEYWQQRRAKHDQNDAAKSGHNAYAAARHKRDNFS